jgi:hypothetical protein
MAADYVINIMVLEEYGMKLPQGCLFDLEISTGGRWRMSTRI